MIPEGSATTTTNAKPIYYFGYGPIINPMVRARRRLKTCGERPAVLPEFRLTFAYGGIANMVQQRGYEVHGILMKFTSPDDWKQFQEYDAGYNESDLVSVIPYDASEEDEPILAYAMSMKEYDASKVESPIEQLPTERYLKLIANGMRQYQVDDDYIQDQIMAVPYVPSRKAEEYRTLPQCSDVLPKITFSKYQRLCQRSKDVNFILNNKVCRLGPHDPAHPAVVWVKSRIHGKHDSTLIIHQTIVEPDLPMVDTMEELTPEHHAWAENHCVEFFRKCNLSVTKVYDIVPDEEAHQRQTERGGLSLLFCCFSGQGRQQDRIMAQRSSSGNPALSHHGGRLSSSGRRRRSSHLTGAASSDIFLMSSELMHREIRRNAGDGGDTDDNSSTQ